jgi:hypothetical protein
MTGRLAIRRTIAAISAACQIACNHPTSPAAVPIDPNAPIVGAHTGAVAIDYAGANAAPGSTVAGCGPTIAGCAGRLRLSFRLRSAGAGVVLFTAGTLHGATKTACLSAVGPGFSLAANAAIHELQNDRALRLHPESSAIDSGNSRALGRLSLCCRSPEFRQSRVLLRVRPPTKWLSLCSCAETARHAAVDHDSFRVTAEFSATCAA